MRVGAPSTRVYLRAHYFPALNYEVNRLIIDRIMFTRLIRPIFRSARVSNVNRLTSRDSDKNIEII